MEITNQESASCNCERASSATAQPVGSWYLTAWNKATKPTQNYYH